MSRNDGRQNNQLREIKFTRNWLNNAEGSVIVEFGILACFVLPHLHQVCHVG